MRRFELATAAMMIILAGVVVTSTWQLNYWVRLVPGPSFFPVWLAGATIAFALALVVITLRKPDREVGFPGKRGLVQISLVYGGLWLIVMLSDFTGFLLASTSFVLFTLLVTFRRPLVPSLATTAVIGCMVHFLFNVWLDVRLPTGVVGF